MNPYAASYGTLDGSCGYVLGFPLPAISKVAPPMLSKISLVRQ
jgi:hypothetical protein